MNSKSIRTNSCIAKTSTRSITTRTVATVESPHQRRRPGTGLLLFLFVIPKTRDLAGDDRGARVLESLRWRRYQGQSRVRSFDATLTRHGIRALTRKSPATIQVNVGKLCNQTCHHCHVDAGPQANRTDDARDGGAGDRGARGESTRRDRGYHRRRAGAESELCDAGGAGARARPQGDRAMQPDGDARTGNGMAGGILPAVGGRAGLLAAVLHRGEHRSSARRGRVRQEHRGVAATECRRIRARRAAARPGVQSDRRVAAAVAEPSSRRNIATSWRAISGSCSTDC